MSVGRSAGLIHESVSMKRFETILEKVIYGVIRAMGCVPNGLADLKSRFWGAMWFVLDHKHRRIILENLAIAFSEWLDPGQRRVLARRVMIRLMRMLFEIGRYARFSGEEMSRWVRVEGQEHIRDALAQGKGVLVLTAHFGNWEYLPIGADLIQVPLSIVYRPLDFQPLDRVIARLRSKFGAELIPSSRGAMRGILRALAKGRIVAMLMDQNVDWYEGVWVDFFGKPACTNKGMAVIAIKTGAPVVPVFMLPDGDNRFVITFQPAMHLSVTGDRTSDIETNTALFTQVIEAMIRRHPDQWFWVHQRWKTANACPVPWSADGRRT